MSNQSNLSDFDRLGIAKNWLPRYTGMKLDDFGDYVLLTNFHDYVQRFSEKFSCDIQGLGKPMQAATNSAGLTIINFGIGSANAATIMDLLLGYMPKGVLFLGKCGGLKLTTEIGHFILPIAAIRGEGTSDDYLLPEVPALPLFQTSQVRFGQNPGTRTRLSNRSGVYHQSSVVGA